MVGQWPLKPLIGVRIPVSQQSSKVSKDRVYMSTTRSHYLPRTYLKHFLYDGSLVMYKKGAKFFNTKINPDERIFVVSSEATLANIGVENHLYNPKVEGISSDDLEAIFHELGEDTYDSILTSIYELSEEAELPRNIKNQLCIFMSAMRVRTPLFKKELEEMDEKMRKYLMAANYKRMSVKEVINHAKIATGQDISEELAVQIKNSFVNKEYELKYPNAYFIKYALLLIEHHIDIFHKMTMTICKSNRRFFITNDSPLVYFVPPEKVNMYNPPKALVSQFSEVFFPLSKDLLVHMCWKKEKEKIRKITRKFVDIANYNIAHHSLDFIFAPMKINELKKFTEEYIPYPFKLVMD